nr:MAG TPA: hypothetical protein [Caudoviricetes sp.]
MHHPKNVRYVTKWPAFEAEKLKKLKNCVCIYSYFMVWLICRHFILCIVLNTAFTILQTIKKAAYLRPLIISLVNYSAS